MSRPRGLAWARLVLCAAAATAAAVPAWAGEDAEPELGVYSEGEARFFADCPHRPRRRVHQDAAAYDLHVAAYQVANVMELEVLRLADLAMDVAALGVEFRPFEWTVRGIRKTYAKLGHSRSVVRVGELVDAFQIPELSLGDAAVVTGQTVTPGSGTLVRVNKLIDWTQHVGGDLNRMVGRSVGQRQGLLPSQFPAKVVDGAQAIVNGGFHGLGVLLARALDRGLRGIEQPIEWAVNLNRPTPHRDTTVFFRMPLAIYRAHELWILRHRAQIYVGTAAHVAQLTHAQLFHPRRGPSLEWWLREYWEQEPETVVLVTDRRVAARAPQSLRTYAVPAAWILHPAGHAHNPLIHRAHGQTRRQSCKQQHAAIPVAVSRNHFKTTVTPQITQQPHRGDLKIG